MRKLKALVWSDPFKRWDNMNECVSAKTEIGMYRVWRTDAGQWMRAIPDSPVHARIFDDEPCDSIDHGKQLCQADYERRVEELFEPLPANVTSAAHDLFDWATDCNATGMYANTKSQAEIVCDYLLSAMGAE